MGDPKSLSHLQEFEGFVEIHESFFEGLYRHQESLVRNDVESALRELRKLHADLRAHITRENEKVLPVLEQRGGWSRAGEPRFYREEHGRILELLDRFELSTSMLVQGSPGYPRAAAILIANELSLRTLLEHHDDREKHCLYLDLLKITTPEERRQMLA
jgi:iron-sulfur cluster repair protein YtfE (RIC family)